MDQKTRRQIETLIKHFQDTADEHREEADRRWDSYDTTGDLRNKGIAEGIDWAVEELKALLKGECDDGTPNT